MFQQVLRFSLALLFFCLPLAIAQSNGGLALEEPAAAWTLESRLPQETLVFLSFPHIQNSRKAFVNTTLWKLWEEPEMQQFVKSMYAPYEAQVKPMLDMVEQQAGISACNLHEIFAGELSIAVTGVDMEKEKVSAILAIDLGKHKELLEKHFNQFRQQGMIPVREVEYKDGKIYDFGVACAAFQGNVLLASSDMALMQKVIDGASPALNTLSSFEKGKKKTIASNLPIFFAFANIKEALKQFSGTIPGEALQVGGMTGLIDIASISVGSSFSGNYFDERLFIEIPAARRALTSLIHADSVLNPKFISQIPPHAIGFVGFRMNFAGMCEEIEKTISSMDPSGRTLEMYKQQKQQLEEKLGFKIADINKSFGNDCYVFQCLPSTGSLFPYTIAMMEVKDNEAFMQWIEKSSGLIGCDLKKVKYAEKEIYYISRKLGNLGTDPFRKLDRTYDPIEALLLASGYLKSGNCFFVENGIVYKSPCMLGLKNFINDRAGWKNNITECPEFLKARSQMPEKTSLVVYENLRPLFQVWATTFWPVFKSLEGIARSAGIPFEMAMMPRVSTISKHILPGFVSYDSDEDGVSFKNYSVGGSFVVIVPIVAVAGVGGVVEEMQRRNRD